MVLVWQIKYDLPNFLPAKLSRYMVLEYISLLCYCFCSLAGDVLSSWDSFNHFLSILLANTSVSDG